MVRPRRASLHHRSRPTVQAHRWQAMHAQTSRAAVRARAQAWKTRFARGANIRLRSAPRCPSRHRQRFRAKCTHGENSLATRDE